MHSIDTATVWDVIYWTGSKIICHVKETESCAPSVNYFILKQKKNVCQAQKWSHFEDVDFSPKWIKEEFDSKSQTRD